jgi:hypothetical protein
MKTFIAVSILFVVLGVAFLPYLVRADDHHNPSVTNITIHESFTQRVVEQAPGVALGIATAQHSFNSSTFALQWSVGAATYENTDALSLAIGKRVGGILLNGSIGFENGSKGAGIGITGAF